MSEEPEAVPDFPDLRPQMYPLDTVEAPCARCKGQPYIFITDVKAIGQVGVLDSFQNTRIVHISCEWGHNRYCIHLIPQVVGRGKPPVITPEQMVKTKSALIAVWSRVNHGPNTGLENDETPIEEGVLCMWDDLAFKSIHSGPLRSIVMLHEAGSVSKLNALLCGVRMLEEQRQSLFDELLWIRQNHAIPPYLPKELP